MTILKQEPFVGAIWRYDVDAIDRLLLEDPELATGTYNGQTSFQVLYNTLSYHSRHNQPPLASPPPPLFNRCLLSLLSAPGVSLFSQTPHALSQIVAAGHVSSFLAIAHLPWVRQVIVIPGHLLPRDRINGHHLLRLAAQTAQVDPGYPFLAMVHALCDAGVRPDHVCPTHGDPLVMAISPRNHIHPDQSRHRAHRELGPVCRLLCSQGATVSMPALQDAVITESVDVIESVLSSCCLPASEVAELASGLQSLFPMGSAMLHRFVLGQQTRKATVPASTAPRL